MNDPTKKTEIATGEDVFRVAKELEGALPVMAVYLTKEGNLAFCGFSLLTTLLQQGGEIEKYLNEKIANARAVLVKSN